MSDGKTASTPRGGTVRRVFVYPLGQNWRRALVAPAPPPPHHLPLDLIRVFSRPTQTLGDALVQQTLEGLLLFLGQLPQGRLLLG